MSKIYLLHAVNHDGSTHEAGSWFEGRAETVGSLIEAGAAQERKPEVEDTVSIETAQAKAKSIVEAANADAKKIQDDAQREAQNITGKAQEAADLKGKEADDLLAGAKTEAEDIVKAAQEAARSGAQTKPTTASK